jgi:hypothetical protein
MYTPTQLILPGLPVWAIPSLAISTYNEFPVVPEQTYLVQLWRHDEPHPKFEPYVCMNWLSSENHANILCDCGPSWVKFREVIDYNKLGMKMVWDDVLQVWMVELQETLFTPHQMPWYDDVLYVAEGDQWKPWRW